MTWHSSWQALLDRESSLPYFVTLRERVLADRSSGVVFPPAGQVMAALRTPLDRVRCVILGQDPYHKPGEACGLAFSVTSGPIPPSLRVILGELRASTGISTSCGDLSGWADRGVLLLNTVLTVRADTPGSHRGIGWERFTRAVLREVIAQPRPIVWMLWGADAKKTCAAAWSVGGVGRNISFPAEMIAFNNGTEHLILTAPHPSPLAAMSRNKFLGCGHFRRANEWLRECGAEPIDWSIS